MGVTLEIIQLAWLHKGSELYLVCLLLGTSCWAVHIADVTQRPARTSKQT